jgi:hypothetical protein
MEFLNVEALLVLKLSLHDVDDQLLGLDLGHLHIAMRVTIEEQLLGDLLPEESEDVLGLGSEAIENDVLDFGNICLLGT